MTANKQTLIASNFLKASRAFDTAMGLRKPADIFPQSDRHGTTQATLNFAKYHEVLLRPIAAGNR